MEYEDFDLQIEHLGGQDYRVSVLRSPGGEAAAVMQFPYGELALKNRLLTLENALLKASGRRRRAPSPEEQEVQDFGRTLYEALLTGDVRSRFDVSWDRVRRQGKGLRIKLRFQKPTLAALPWEFLYNAGLGEYLALSKHTPLVRYLELPQPLPSLAVTPPLRILGMIANPTDLEELDVAVEKQRMEQALGDLIQEGLVELTWLSGQSWRALQRTMRRGPWHIFHFIGHGGFDEVKDEGFLVFADREGKSQPISAASLARLIADHASLRLVLLNSCDGGQSGADVFSSTASILVRRGTPSVLAMQYQITDRAAIEFSQTFYEAIVDGLPIESAVTDARVAISVGIANSLEWGTPVLFSHAPDGVLFSLADRPRPTPVVPDPTEEEVKAAAAGRRRQTQPGELGRFTQHLSEYPGPG